MVSIKSLSSQTPSLLQRKFLTFHYICIKFIQQQFQTNSENSLLKVMTIQSNSGSVPVVTDDLSIKLLTRKPRKCILYPIILTSHLGTLARRVNVIIFS